MSTEPSAPQSGYSVQIDKHAWEELMDVPEKRRAQIFTALENLESEPRPSGVVKMAGVEDLYRIRVGDYRIIYSVQDHLRIVLVEKVGHRRDVYR